MSRPKHQIAIQHIAIHWSKEDRGAEPGTIRNSLPRELAFCPPSDNESGWFHSIVFDADHHYRKDERWRELDSVDKSSLPVRTRIEDAHLWIKPHLHTGKLRPPNLESWIVRLPFGHRAIIRLNGVHDGRRQRIYREHHLTIGFGTTATLDLPLFREIDERVLLY